MYAISTLLLLLMGKVSFFSSIVEQLLKLCPICKSPSHGPRNYVDPTWERSANRPRLIYQYSSMASRLSGQNCKFFKSLLSSNSQKRLRYKENNTKYRSLTRKPRSHVRILIYRTWPIVVQFWPLSLSRNAPLSERDILVPRAYDPSGLQQESIPAAGQKDRRLWGREWEREGPGTFVCACSR